jgi:hypothetical protein
LHIAGAEAFRHQRPTQQNHIADDFSHLVLFNYYRFYRSV